MDSSHVAPSIVIATLTLAAALAPTAAHAATVTVNTTTPDSSTDGRCGLIEAVTAVNRAATYRSCAYTADGQLDRIVVSAGTHTVQSELFLSRAVEIVGASQSTTIINSGGFGIFSFAGYTAASTTLTLRTMTLQRASTQPLPVNGVRIESNSLPAHLELDRVRVRNCNMAGVSLRGDLVTANIVDSVIENNEVGIVGEEATFYLLTSTIANNRAGIDLTMSGPSYTSFIDRSTIRDNVRSESGAGLKFTVSDPDANDDPRILIYSSTFSGNQATGDGGGVYTTGSLHFFDTLFSNNTATGGGGGLYMATDSRLRVSVYNSAFRSNRAAHGAGLNVTGNGPTTSLMIFDSSLTDNVATGNGGAIFTSGQIDQAENITIHNNQAARGGAMYHDLNGELHLNHLTVTQNRATQSGAGGGFRLSGGNHFLKFSILSENRAGSGTTPPLNNLITLDDEFFRAEGCLVDSRAGSNAFPIPSDSGGGTNIVAAPRLGTLTTPSGQITAVRPLLTGSPAIDAIPATGSGDWSDADQLGRSRPVDGDFDGVAEGDIGAIEARQTSVALFQPETMTVAANSNHTLVIESNSNYSNGQGRVLQAASLTNPAPFVTLQSGSIPAGTYGITVRFKRASNAASIQLAVGPSAGSTTNVGAGVDTYRSSPDWMATYVGFYTVTWTGTRYFKFSAPSKSSSSSGYFMYLDSIRLFTNSL